MQKRVTILITLVLTLALASSLSAAQSGSEKKMSAGKDQDSEAPFVCSLTALTVAERAHHQEVSKQLRAAVKETRELPNGYAFRLPGDKQALAMASDWISLERLCCPFFTFQLEIGSGAKPIWLRMTGRDGVKQFMQLEFGIK